MRWVGVSIAVLMLVPTSAAIDQSEVLYLYEEMPEPVRFAVLELEEILRDKGLVVALRDIHAPSSTASVFRVTVGDLQHSPTLPHHPLASNLSVTAGRFGSFEIRVRKSGESAEVLIAGSDPAGAMYGLLEVAEQIDNAGTSQTPYRAVRDGVHTPFLHVRGAQILLHRQAMQDPWSWFYSEEFWEGFLDTLARSRFNLLDLHGIYDIITSKSYNVLPYFTHIPSFPKAGVGVLQAEQNAAMLGRIIELAENRGIRVFLVSYNASWQIPDHEDPDEEETEESLGAYTSQAWTKLLGSCPKLNGAGVRVGESGRGVLFYQRYVVPAIVDAEGDHPLVLRNWLLKPDDIETLSSGHKNATAVEIKFNGDFLGLPYQISGGRFIGWTEYTYGDLLSKERNYDAIFQLRASGDHRVFPWIDPDAVRRFVKSCRLGDGVGMTLQPIGGYGPISDTYSNTAYEDFSYWKWSFERDWYWWLIWGRLAYQPDLPREIFDYHFRRHFPFLPTTFARSALQALTDMSSVVPTVYSTACLGPDQRNTAPELETAGSIADLYATINPLDTTTIQSILELTTHRVEGTASGKKSPLDLLDRAVSKAGESVTALGQALELRPTASMGSADARIAPTERKRWQELRAWQLDARALYQLAMYHLAKTRGAYNLGLYRLTGSYTNLQAAQEDVQSASKEWAILSAVTDRRYRPFPEVLCMRTTQFHWLDQIAAMEANQELIAQERSEWNDLAKNTRWRPSFGHVQPDNHQPGQDLALQLSFPPNVPVKGLTMRYRNSTGKG
ncbi:MAG: hypothetical protein ABIH23_28520, partial [bacterium]